MSDKKYVFAKGVQKSAMTVQEIQDIASLQKRLSELEEQAQALVKVIEHIKFNNSLLKGDDVLISKALEAYEAWKSNNGGGDEKG